MERWKFILLFSFFLTACDASSELSGFLKSKDSSRISIEDITVNEGETGSISITVDSPVEEDLVLEYTITAGSADSSTDFTPITGSITIPKGSSSVEISLQTLEDSVREADETLSINFTADSEYLLETPDVLVTIVDNEPAPIVQFTAGSDSVAEDDGSGFKTIDVTLAGTTTQEDVTVDYTISGGSAVGSGEDFTLSDGTLTFSASGTQTISIVLADDNVYEPDKNLILTLENLSPNAAMGALSSFDLTITSEDPKPTLEFALISDSTNEDIAGASAAVEVQLSHPSQTAITVDYSITGGSAQGLGVDYTLSSGTLNFAAMDVSENINIQINNDNIFENANESINLLLQNISSEAIAGTQLTHIHTINDEDVAPSISIDDTTSEEGELLSFTVSLSHPTVQTVAFDWSSNDGVAIQTEDYITSSGSAVQIAPLSLSTTISVSGAEDSISEGSEAMGITLSGLVNTTAGDLTATGTITDDDPLPSLSINDAVVTEGGVATFTVTLSTLSGQDISFDWDTSDLTATQPEDYLSTSANDVVIPKGALSVDITVTTVNEYALEGAETMTVTLSDLNGAQAGDLAGELTINNGITGDVLLFDGSGGSSLNGVNLTDCGGGDACDSANPYILNTSATYAYVSLKNGAVITGNQWVSGAPAPGNGKIVLHVLDKMEICATCSVEMSSKGYTGGNGPGAGTNYTNNSGTGGGAYGGNAGDGETTAGGLGYGSISDPQDLGSGGGNPHGSYTGPTGGGNIQLLVDGTLTIDGKIEAHGKNGITHSSYLKSGGAAGGGIKIITDTLAGSGGSISANGGAGLPTTSRGSGGGGGGRISIVYKNDNYVGGIDSIISAYGGASGYRKGGAGTIYLFQDGVQTNGTLILDNNNSVGSSTLLENTTSFYDQLIIKRQGNMEIPIGYTLDSTTYDFTGGVVTNRGSLLKAFSTLGWRLINYGTLNIPGNNLTIASAGTLELGQAFVVNNLTVQSGGKITHVANSTSQTYIADITASNNITIDAGGVIDISSKGFVGGSGSGAGVDSGGNSGTGGGGYGGNGGAGQTSAAGSIYGSIINPQDLGSGGGKPAGNKGSSGGGLLLLNVTNTLTLNGTILANGGNAVSYSSYIRSGGGSGGGVNINTSTLAGSGGVITVNGGVGITSGFRYSGGGAGGRIAIIYDNDSYAGGALAGLDLQAFGGTGYGKAAAGSVFLRHTGTQVNGTFMVDNNNLSGATTPLVDISTTFDEVISTTKGNIEIPTGYTLTTSSLAINTGAITNRGTLDSSINSLDGHLINYGSLSIPGNNLTIANGGTLELGIPLVLDDLIITSGGELTHVANGATQNYIADVSINNNLTVDLGGSINVNNKGFAGGEGPGQGADSGGNSGTGGGGYGGAGGNGQTSVAGGTYGSATDPQDLGSGGGNPNNSPGSSGGGLLLLNVLGTFTLNGAITANGRNYVSYSSYITSGGGSGGGVNITANTFAGSTGSISAIGGSGVMSFQDSGSGGGGRVSINYTTDLYTGTLLGSLPIDVNGGSGGLNPGSVGTINIVP